MLFFVGLGLHDQRDISVKGLETVYRADCVYAEFYTSRLMGASVHDLENIYGKKVNVISRDEVEANPSWLEVARDKDIVFLVGGDPMISTTHLDLRLRAIEMGIKTKIIHSSSIVTAIPGLTGLQNYRFGRSATIPFAYTSRGSRIISETPYTVLKDNLDRNLHTMFFLDIQEPKYMTINEGVELLLESAENVDDMVLKDHIGIGVARAGSEDPTIKADLLSKLNEYDFGDPLHILVIPANLHFMEEKALAVLADLH